MPLPIIPFVAGGALLALIGAGKAEQKSGGASTNAPENVAPTQQSTGGTNGGAQAPSHSDVVNEPSSGSAATPANIASMFGAGAVPDNAAVLQGDIPSGTGPGVIADPVRDPWAPTSGSSLTPAPVSPVKILTGAGAVTAKAAADAFTTVGRSFGAIW